MVGDNEQRVRRLIEESFNVNRPGMLQLAVARDVRIIQGRPVLPRRPTLDPEERPGTRDG